MEKSVGSVKDKMQRLHEYLPVDINHIRRLYGKEYAEAYAAPHIREYLVNEGISVSSDPDEVGATLLDYLNLQNDHGPDQWLGEVVSFLDILFGNQNKDEALKEQIEALKEQLHRQRQQQMIVIMVVVILFILAMLGGRLFGK